MSPIPNISHFPSYNHALPCILNAAWANSNVTIAPSNTTTSSNTFNPQSPVQWQSALWALVALALNAMTQRSGADSMFTTSLISLVRSSPLICLVDALSSVAWVVVGKYYGETAANSIRLMSMGTNLSMGDKEEDEADSKTNSDKAGLPLVGTIFFILGPLPQAIKIAGMQGVPWTKAAGLIFIIAYLVRIWELCLRKRAAKLRQPKFWGIGVVTPTTKIPEVVRRRLKKGSGEMYAYAYFWQCWLWFWIMHSIICRIGPSPTSKESAVPKDGDGQSTDDFISFAMNMNYMWPLALGAGPAFYYGKIYLGEQLFRRYSDKLPDFSDKIKRIMQACLLYGPAALSSFLAFVSLLYIFHFLTGIGTTSSGPATSKAAFLSTVHSVMEVSRMALTLLTFAFTVPIVGVGVVLVGLFYEDVMGETQTQTVKVKKSKLSEEEEEKQTDEEFAKMMNLGFALCSLVFAVLYYGCIYDAGGTSKPGWSDMLG